MRERKDIMTDLPPVFDTGAEFSPDRVYRYALWRTWGREPSALFVGLNPSTAAESVNDPTIVREMGFARAWGFGGLYKANIFGLAATDPRELKRVEDPVGPMNDVWLRYLFRIHDVKVVVAWGVGGALNGRGAAVAKMFQEEGIATWCLGTTKEGHPKHPLYLAKNTELVRFP